MIMGSFTLHSGVLWVNEVTAPSVMQQITRTILGNIHIRHVAVTKRKIIIEARDGGNRSRGYFTREQVDFIKESESNGTVVVLQHRGLSYNTVVIAGSVALTPKKEIESVTNEDPYTGTITFQEI